MSKNPLSVLKQYWGYDTFRPMQEDVISSVLSGHDTLALLATGAGKSITYQVPALCLPGKTIVISPLIALMQDQVSNLQAKGIKAKALFAGQGYRQLDLILDDFVHGPLKILYVSPERLETDIFIERFKRADVSLIAVDESHCISQWGHDFRPSYFNIKNLRDYKPDIPIIAVTATATPEVKVDIVEQLELKEPNVITSSFGRNNLSLSVMLTENKLDELLHVLQKVKGSGLIYVRSRKEVKKLSDILAEQGLSVAYYHAGIPLQKREKIQKDWILNKTRVIVCTNAFGMGVDKSNVRFVIHYDVPPSLEEYYQEAGRAGRDGKSSWAVSIIGVNDIVKLEKHHLQTFPEISFINELYVNLCNYLKIAYGSGAGESFEINLEQFALQYQLNMSTMFSGLKILEKEGWLMLNEGFKNPAHLLFTSDKSQISLSARNQGFKSKLLVYLLRRYEGIFIDYVSIDEGAIANELDVSIEMVIRELKIMDREAILSYKEASELPRIIFLLDRPEKNSFAIDKKEYKKRKSNAELKMKAVQEFMTADKCRQQLVLDYFGENSAPCGKCDICMGSKDSSFTQEEKEGLYNHLQIKLKNSKMLTDDYIQIYPYNKRKKAYACILQLANESRINIDDNNFMTLTNER